VPIWLRPAVRWETAAIGRVIYYVA
jgi:hypothetical protein